MNFRLRELLWPLFGVAAGLLVFGAQPQVHALPEYATRTGEPCATCHVNPAGGGPRTQRGALWLAQGRPDTVPELPASAESANTETADEKSAGADTGSAEPATADTASADAGGGKALYQKLSCGGCHGASGEGAFGPALNVRAGVEGAEKAIRNGQGTMPGYDESTLPDPGLASLLQFLNQLAGIEVKQPAAADPAKSATATPRPLGPSASSCGGAGGAAASRSCGGN